MKYLVIKAVLSREKIVEVVVAWRVKNIRLEVSGSVNANAGPLSSSFSFHSVCSP